MQIINYPTFEQDLPHYFEEVSDSQNPVIITRDKGKPMVLMSLDDYNAYEETAYLLSTTANAQHLKESIAQSKAGKVIQRELVDIEDLA